MASRLIIFACKCSSTHVAAHGRAAGELPATAKDFPPAVGMDDHVTPDGQLGRDHTAFAHQRQSRVDLFRRVTIGRVAVTEPDLGFRADDAVLVDDAAVDFFKKAEDPKVGYEDLAKVPKDLKTLDRKLASALIGISSGDLQATMVLEQEKRMLSETWRRIWSK